MDDITLQKWAQTASREELVNPQNYVGMTPHQLDVIINARPHSLSFAATRRLMSNAMQAGNPQAMEELRIAEQNQPGFSKGLSNALQSAVLNYAPGGALLAPLASQEAQKNQESGLQAVATIAGLGATLGANNPQPIGTGGAAVGGEAAAGTAEAAADIAAGDAVAAAGGYGGTTAGTVAGGNTLGSLAGSPASSGGGFFQNGNWIPTAVGGGLTLLGMNKQEKAAEEAARLAGAATDIATAENARQFNIGQENLAPWLTAGKGALTEQQKLMGINGFDPANSLAELAKSPGYQFRLKTGRQGLDASSAARGGMGSGKAMTNAIGFNQDFATNEYGTRLSQLADMSGTGNATGTRMANNGTNYANTNSSLLLNNADIQGNAGMVGANARTSGLYGLSKLGLDSWDKYRRA